MPREPLFRSRRAATIENRDIRLTLLEEGGHIAEVFDKACEINPLWSPPWPSIEPSLFVPGVHAEYGDGVDARLLAGIMGHNLCLDIFGGPSAEEAAAGLSPHGDASIVRYELDSTGTTLRAEAHLPLAQLRVERQVELHDRRVRIRESVENLSGCDRPVGWTQHVTLGPPFLQKGQTEFRASATQSKAFETAFGVADYLIPGADFIWPFAPHRDGTVADLRVFTPSPVSSAYTAHLMDPQRDTAFFVAFSPTTRLAFGYVWKRADFPWMGIWEENHSRIAPPWNGMTVTRGMEFGVSPMPESRRQMIDRGRLFGVPTYRWIPARSTVAVEYWIVLQTADAPPEDLPWPAGPV
jgi:hypothetical protein